VDSLRLIDGQWLIAHRLVRVDWWSPATLYVDQAERARARAWSRDHEREAGGATDPGVRVEVRGRVGWIILDRPEVMNRIDGAMREALLSALHRHAADRRVYCIAIAGSPGAFSAGANIDDMQAVQRDGDGEEIVRRTAAGARIVRTIREMNKPVVAVVDGVAAGAGMNLALACDLRVGSSRAAFVSSFVRIGLVPDWGGFHFLARRVGMGRAADLMMTGRRVDAEGALHLGLLEYLYADDTFEEEVRVLLDRLAEAPAGAIAAIKRGLELGASGGLDAVFAYEAAQQPALFLSENCREGIAAFREKRKPDFNQGN
jgi:2-(1,2-epoxy-1,2-dihydrophenyl)acetyl-CoA isomerase